MPKLSRRQWLKIGVAAGGFAAFGLSYRDVAQRAVEGLVNGTSGKVTRDRIHANSLPPEGLAEYARPGGLHDSVFWLLDTVRHPGAGGQAG